MAAEGEEKEPTGDAEGEGKPDSDAEAREATSAEGETSAEDAAGDESGDESEEDESEDDAGEGDADAEAEAVGAAPEPEKAGKGKDGPKMSAGARLAAQKAAKAAKKAAKRGKSNAVQSEVAKRTAAASEWATKHKNAVWIALGVLALAIAGFTAWRLIQASRAEEASNALEEATKTANAPIRAEGDDDPAGVGEDEDDEESYPSLRSRAEKALRQYRRVVSNYSGTDAAVWARLGMAGALYDLGRWRESRQAYDRALQEGGDDPSVAWRALEGMGFTYEAEEKWREATQRYQELSRTGNRMFRDIADYHLSRMYLAQGEDVRAKETLRALVERLHGRSAEGEETDEIPELQYVLTQAEARLAELDPTAVPRRGGGLGGPGGGMGGMGGMPPGGPDSLTKEQIDELIRQMQQKMGSKAPPGGGGGGGGE